MINKSIHVTYKNIKAEKRKLFPKELKHEDKISKEQNPNRKPENTKKFKPNLKSLKDIESLNVLENKKKKKCNCKNGCINNRCYCNKIGICCTNRCKCKECCNMEEKSTCAKNHLRAILDLSEKKLNKIHELFCKCGSATMQELIKNYECSDCQDLSWWSFCRDEVVG
jgi:hypothetical protein